MARGDIRVPAVVGDFLRRAHDAALAVEAATSLSRLVPADPATMPTGTEVQLYDATVRNSELRATTRKLFVDGHYARAVEEAYKCLNNDIKRRSGVSAKDGADLMFVVFDPDNPILRLNQLKTPSQRDEQEGYRRIFAGCMAGLRNPRAHEHLLSDRPETALEMLIWANHLMEVAARTKKARRRSKR